MLVYLVFFQETFCINLQTSQGSYSPLTYLNLKSLRVYNLVLEKSTVESTKLSSFHWILQWAEIIQTPIKFSSKSNLYCIVWQSYIYMVLKQLICAVLGLADAVYMGTKFVLFVFKIVEWNSDCETFFSVIEKLTHSETQSFKATKV